MARVWWIGVAVSACAGGCLNPDVSLEDDEGSSGMVASSSGTTTPQSSTTTDADDSSSTAEAITGGSEGCEQTPLRVATFNIESVQNPGTDPFVGLAATLSRMGADVVCMQEVLFEESSQLQAMAESAGYPNVIEADPSPAIGGDLKNACVSRVPIELIASYTARSLSSDPTANDVGRDILAVRVEPEPGCSLALFTVHLKSGGEYEDLFRRQVEATRLAGAVANYRQQRPNEGVVVLGDFNEQLDDSDLGMVLDAIPPTLPQSYSLGNDISLPLRYEPFEPLTEQGFRMAEAFQEDSTDPDTFIGGNFTTRLDYVFYGQVVLEGAEVYNACADNGIDDEPAGGWLPKVGEPLACYTSQIASDHLAIFADLTLP